MAHKVKCFYCGELFDRDKEPFKPIPNRAKRYAHEKCFLEAVQQQEELARDKVALEEYIKGLFHYETLPESISKQIEKYVTECKYTYSGILKSLIYHYEIKQGSKEKANGRIGIVPYVYDDAYQYYFELWKTQQQNKDIDIREYIPEKAQEVHIRIPKRKPMGAQRHSFNFLDKFEQEDK